MNGNVKLSRPTTNSPGPFLGLLSFAKYVSVIYFADEFKPCLYQFTGFLGSICNLRDVIVVLEVDEVGVNESVVDVSVV